MKNFLKNILAPAPVKPLHALAGRPPVLPYWHMVSDEPLPHVAPLYAYRDAEQFKADLDFFLKFFQPVTLADVLAQVRGEKKLPANAFLPTFDDGFREMAEIAAPILKAKGISAAFFVNAATVDNRELCFHQKIALLISELEQKSSPALEEKIETLLRKAGVASGHACKMLKSVRHANRTVLDEAAVVCGFDFAGFLARQKPYLTSPQIRGLLRDGFAVGGHSLDHPFYADLSLDEQLRQTRESVRFVCEKFDVNYRAFAFPHSDAGVTQEFFGRIYREDAVEISFGTGGLLRDPWPGHFQRFSMEKKSGPRSLLNWQLVRRCVRGEIRRA